MYFKISRQEREVIQMNQKIPKEIRVVNWWKPRRTKAIKSGIVREEPGVSLIPHFLEPIVINHSNNLIIIELSGELLIFSYY